MDLSEAAFADIHVVICIQMQFSDGLGAGERSNAEKDYFCFSH